MNYNAKLKDKLSKLLFLELNWEGFKESVNINKDIKLKTKDLYMPIDSEYVAKNAQNEYKINNLPIYYFVEGMLYTLGADRSLSYCDNYILIINNLSNGEEIAKKLIADKIKKDELLDGYLLLKGIYNATGSLEYYEKLLFVGEAIWEQDKNFEELLNEDIEFGINEQMNIAELYLYRAVILKEKGDFAAAKVAVNEYVSKGGTLSPEAELIVNDINNLCSYEKAVELLGEKPEESIKLLLDLTNNFEKNPLLYYYLGVGYRNLENYEKAIYYLNESINIESGILEVVNELGINYACLGDYKNALKYFKKAFEATKDVEICTNIIMCYMELNDKENAILHLDIAKKLNSEDEIVINLERMLTK